MTRTICDLLNFLHLKDVCYNLKHPHHWHGIFVTCDTQESVLEVYISIFMTKDGLYFVLLLTELRTWRHFVLSHLTYYGYVFLV